MMVPDETATAARTANALYHLTSRMNPSDVSRVPFAERYVVSFVNILGAGAATGAAAAVGGPLTQVRIVEPRGASRTIACVEPPPANTCALATIKIAGADHKVWVVATPSRGPTTRMDDAKVSAFGWWMGDSADGKSLTAGQLAKAVPIAYTIDLSKGTIFQPPTPVAARLVELCDGALRGKASALYELLLGFPGSIPAPQVAHPAAEIPKTALWRCLGLISRNVAFTTAPAGGAVEALQLGAS
jgi:hypothetical protein